jgi:hypothetical protein
VNSDEDIGLFDEVIGRTEEGDYEAAMSLLRAVRAEQGLTEQQEGHAEARESVRLSECDCEQEVDVRSAKILEHGAGDKRYVLAAGITCSDRDEYERAKTVSS